MIFGTWGDIEESEFRVICTPVEVESINSAGRDVWVQYDCGKMAACPSEKYAEAGVRIVDTMEKMNTGCDLVAKAEEFTSVKYPMIRDNQILLGCIHPTGHPEEVDVLLERKSLTKKLDFAPPATVACAENYITFET